MRWDRGHRSPNVQDRRGQPAPVGAGLGGMGGIGGLLPLAARFGWKGIAVLVVIFLIWRGASCFSSGGGSNVVNPQRDNQPVANDEQAAFVGFVHDDIQTYWQKQFQQAGRQYRVADLVLFTGAVESACGIAESATGPFYCPSDGHAFIDLGFYDELQAKLGAPGDFAQAYVLAHEMGHHIQNITGGMERSSRSDLVTIELQADCLAGVWAADAQKRDLLEVGDIEEALTAASAIGDDTLQKRAGGRVRPETFTHGSSAQRLASLKKGFSTGDPAACGLNLR
jgi:predicted metalloprotease